MADYWKPDGTPIEDGELYEWYDEMLDQVYGDFMGSYSASRVLKEVDPIAYRVGFHDWTDSQVQDGDLLDEEPELCSEFGEVIDDGEGYDGLCGDCADAAEESEDDDD